MIRTALPLLVAAFITAHPALADDASTKGTIEAVTVYRGQALVTRLVPVDAAKNAPAFREIVVTDLPAMIDAGSLYAEGSAGVAVRSVRFRTRPAENDTREEVRALDDQIAKNEASKAVNARMQALSGEIRAHLDALQGFVAPAATAELKSGVLNAQTIEQLSTFLMTQREKLAQRELSLAAESKALDAAMTLLRQQRQKITFTSSRQINEAVVFITADPAAKGGQLRLRYLVNGASWAPSYNARRAGGASGKAESSMTLEYYASIEQTSGEDWSNVAMTLSTATPNLTATPPSLTPMRLSLAAAMEDRVAGLMNKGYDDALRDLDKARKDAVEYRNRASSRGEPGGPIVQTLGKPGSNMPGTPVQYQSSDEFRKAEETLRNVVSDQQMLDLVTNTKFKRGRSEARPIASRDEGLSINYTIPGSTSLPSRSDHQLVQIASLPIHATFSKIATPLLTEYVYDQANAANDSNIVLLAGPVTAYTDNAFVGSTEISNVAIGQSFTVGFGIDAALRASRELVERTETTQGGNRIIELTYRLSVENFGNTPADVRLMDRRPLTQNADIQISLGSTSQELSKDPEAAALLKSAGVLRWDVTVPPQSIGGKAQSVEYKLRLEHDKQMSLLGMGS